MDTQHFGFEASTHSHVGNLLLEKRWDMDYGSWTDVYASRARHVVNEPWICQRFEQAAQHQSVIAIVIVEVVMGWSSSTLTLVEILSLTTLGRQVALI